MKRKLGDVLTHRCVLFLGYSLRDPDIEAIYHEALSDVGDLKCPAFILTEESNRHMLRDWLRRGIRTDRY